MKIKKILFVSFVVLTTICHAQSKGLLYDELHFEDELCKIDIVVTPMEVMRSSWIDTGCFHRKQPISMLSFVYKNEDYTFYIDNDFEMIMVDSIISWVENRQPIEITVLFFQSCAEPWVLDDIFYPLGIITHACPYSLDGMMDPSGINPLQEKEEPGLIPTEKR